MKTLSQNSRAVLDCFNRTELVLEAMQLQPLPNDYRPKRISIYANGGGLAATMIEDGKIVWRDNSVDCLFENRTPDLFEICFDGETVYVQAHQEVIVNRIRHVEFIIRSFPKTGVR